MGTIFDIPEGVFGEYCDECDRIAILNDNGLCSQCEALINEDTETIDL